MKAMRRSAIALLNPELGRLARLHDSPISLRASTRRRAPHPPLGAGREQSLVRGETRTIDRVVIVTDDCVESGGAAVITLASIRMLRQRGIPVTVLTGDAGDNTWFAKAGVDVVPIDTGHILEGGRPAAALRGIYNRKAHRVIADWIRANDTAGTVYHLHNWHKRLSPSAFMALKPVASRLFMTAHDYFLACPNGGFFQYPKGEVCALKPMSAACLMSSCDKRNYGHKLWRVGRQAVQSAPFAACADKATVLVVHEGMRAYLERNRALPDVAVLRNPVVPWCTTRVAAERNSDVFFVGRLELDKGVDLLAAAAERIGLRVRVIGDGPMKGEFQARYPDIEWLGRLPHDQIAKAVKSARMLVLPTRWPETFGLVALEALMSGIPVVASNAALISREIVENGLGVGCAPSDIPGLAAQIAQLLDDDDRIESMSRKAFASAGQLAPTLDQWADKLVELYRHKLTAAC